MTDNEADIAAAQRAIAQIPRRDLPEWLAQALDILSRHAGLFPPLEVGEQEILEHLYPH